MSSRTHGLKSRMQKRFDRFLLFLSLKKNFNTRWAHRGTTWEEYVKLFLKGQRRQKTMRVRAIEYERMKTEYWEPVIIKTWQFDSVSPPPHYVCEECEGQDTMMQYDAVRYKSPEGRLSLLRCLISICSVCGAQKIRDANHGFEGRDEFFFTIFASSNFGDMNLDLHVDPIYILSYNVMYGDRYSRTRGQVNARNTHECTKVLAESCRPGEIVPTPLHISEANITAIRADGVTLKKGGGLYQTLMPIILEYERERMKKYIV